jgi:hypothetical protein
LPLPVGECYKVVSGMKRALAGATIGLVAPSGDHGENVRVTEPLMEPECRT